MIRDAATCDRERCLGLLLEPADYPGTFEDVLTRAGWTYGPEGHTCPACQQGRGPVDERGECLHCGGRTGIRHDVERCRNCGHPTPDPVDPW